jgi:hypothetical protein
MTIFDVNKEQQQPTTEIRWSTEADTSDQCFNLIKGRDHGITLHEEGLENIFEGNSMLCENKDEAESLIKALQKAIELGWVK